MQAPTRLQLLVITFLTASILGVSYAGLRSWLPPFTTETVFLAMFLITLSVAADFFDVEVPMSSHTVSLSVSAALCFAAALTLGPLIGALVAATGTLIVDLLQRRSSIKLLFNMANYLCATFLTGWIYVSMADMTATPIETWSNLLATLSAAITYTVAESGMLALALSVALDSSIWRTWRATFGGIFYELVTLPTLGSLIPVIKDQNPLALAIAVVPLLGPYLAFKGYQRVRQETRATMELLADLLDRRDPYTSDHSKRVAAYVHAIVDHLRQLSFEEAEVLFAAARIHDLGKVATSDIILRKPGTLTAEEREAIQRHASDGADILKNLTMYHDAAVLVRHHHERWDGKGYPDNLVGEAIPLGARILAVADAYDAMTSDRVYRPALPHHVAMAEIRRGAGTQFDPVVVEAFEKAMGTVRKPAEVPSFKPSGIID